MSAPTRIRPADVPRLLAPGSNVLVQGCSSAPDLLARAVTQAGDALGPMHFTGIQVPGLNRASWLANSQSRFTSFFMTPELKAAGDAVTFLPLRYADILRHLSELRTDAAIFSVSPPDENGLCSFGPTVDFLPDLWPRIPILIAQINPVMPRTSGPNIRFDRLTAVLEAAEALPEAGDLPPDAITARIATFAAQHIPDGTTIQAGLGKLPGALLRVLGDRQGLRIHSGLIGDPVLDLLEAGAIAKGEDIVAGVAIGTRRLYDALPDSGIQFRPVSHTHDPRILAAIPGLVTVNSVMEIDLFGQGYAEAAHGGWNSGPGGATDFAQGAAMGGGTRIVVLPSSAKGMTRIVAPGSGRGPVSLARTDIDIVVTEHGAADLRLKSHDARADALIQIAGSDHREALARAWRDGPGSY
ncbi:MAG: acetyl-CoA hydrolase/transferase C-terminal domain-containing protein [Pseudomonadota bacterium]